MSTGVSSSSLTGIKLSYVWLSMTQNGHHQWMFSSWHSSKCATNIHLERSLTQKKITRSHCLLQQELGALLMEKHFFQYQAALGILFLKKPEAKLFTPYKQHITTNSKNYWSVMTWAKGELGSRGTGHCELSTTRLWKLLSFIMGAWQQRIWKIKSLLLCSYLSTSSLKHLKGVFIIFF